MQIYIMLFWFLYIAIDVIVNWYIIVKQNTSPNHILMLCVRGGIAIAIGGLSNIQTNQFWAWLGFTGGWFWILFDIFLNLSRKLSPFYIGQTAEVDELGQKDKIVFYSAKVLVLIYAIASTIKLFAIN